MAAVNWFCLVLAFAFINSYVCIKVDPNGIPNGNYTTISLKSQTIQPYTKPAIINRNEADNFTLLGDTELSASERTRRLIPYMAFYVPVSELPINKQYASKNNIHATKQLARPSATGSTGSSFIPLPPQYVHSGMQYLPPAPSAASSAPSGHQHYQGNAGLGSYHTHGFGGQQQPQQQQQFHLLPPPTGHSHIHLQPPGPPGPSAASLPTFTGHGKGNGNNHNAFVTFKEVNPKRQKTVQHFPPLTSTASSPSASSSSYENIRQTSSIIKQQKAHHYGISGGGSSSGTAAVYRPRTKQSKINLTPFTPSNTVPGNFVPIVYTPVNSNNNNNILNSHATAAGGEINDSSSYNQDENQQYPKQQHQLQHPRNQPQQIAIEYSSGPLPPSASATLIPIDVQPVPQRHHQQQQQQQHQHNPKQQSQFYSVSNSPVNVDLTHSAVGGGGTVASEDLAHHHQHHNAEAISPPTIYHQNQHHQQQPEHVIIDAPLRTLQQSQTVTGIGSQQQQQQQQLYHGGKSATQFQPPKPESFFDSEIQLQQHQNQHQQHQQQQHNIEQVLKDVNAYSSSTKNSQMMTPQEKYVMYLQQRIRYNKHQQRQHALRHKYREHNTDKEQHYQQQQQNIQPNPSQIFVLSSTMSPPIHVSPGTVTALAPIRPPLPPPSPSHYDPNYPQHSPIHHDLYPRPELKPTASGGVSASATGGSTAAGEEEQILTIPVHSLFGELDTLQQQHNHYSQSHSVSLPSSHHKSHYSKHGSQKPQYIDYVINEPQQSLDDEQQQQQQHQHQLELLKPTLGPPSHAFILVTTDAPFPNEPVTQENYATSLRPPFKNKPKLRLQPVSKEKNVNYPTIREQSPTGRPHVVSITPTGKSHPYNDEDAKYVYVKEEFGQKLSTAQGGGGVGKLKPSNKYENDDNQIPQQRQQQHHHHHQQHQQHDENMPLQTLATRQPITHHQQHNEVQHNVPVTGIESTPPKTILADPNELPDIRTSSLAEILHKLQESNHLPHTLTPDNIDNSIKTLIRILNNLKQTQTIVANPPQHHEIPAHSHPSSPDYDYTTGSEEEQQQPEPHDLSLLTPTGPNKHPGPSTGRPGIDYPNYAEIPQTSFDCSEQRYKGFFGDPETNCQVWHYCDLNGGKASFLCPNGTIFSQIALTCDWWFNVKCATTAQLYVLNERLYKYILPFTPKFPEDYSGPIVDKYLAMKFQEMEEKMRLEKEKALQEEVEADTETEQPVTISEDNHLEETTTEDNINRHVKSHSQQTKHESVNSQVSEQSSERNLLIDDEVDDISQRGTVDNFESTTMATMAATLKSEPISYSLKPIIVSSTAGPDYDEEQSHEYEKRDHDKVIKDLEVKKSDTEELLEDDDKNSEVGTEKSVLPPPPTETATSVASSKKMQITVEKVDVIEIKPDEATGHLIRDMLLNSKHKQNK